MLNNRGYTAALVLGIDTVSREQHAVCIVLDSDGLWYVLDTPSQVGNEPILTAAYLCVFAPQFAINRAGEFCAYGRDV
jgi:hypothetical protein